MSAEPITHIAHRLVNGDRNDVYGHPMDDFEATGRMWAPILGLDEVTPEQVALCMVAVKLSRLSRTPNHRDSIVDVAGYAQTLDMIRQRREEDARDETKAPPP